MRIWGDRNLGNPVRVAIFAEEKGIDLPFMSVNLFESEHKKPEFLAKNSAGLIPVLELDDGSFISETIAICRYLERLHPELSLMGRTPLEEAIIEMWQRRIEFGLFDAARAAFRHTSPMVKVLEPVQIPEWAELNRAKAVKELEVLEPQLADRQFIAGDDFSVADITAVLPLTLLSVIDIDIPESCPSVARWREDVLARPSVTAVLNTPSAAG